MATISPSYGTYTALTVTNLQSLASSATAGWRSARVDLQTSLKPVDVEISVQLTTAAGSPSSDKAVYVYIVPWITTDGGSTWVASDQGTTTLPTSSEGTTTIATPNNMKLLGVLNHTTSTQPLNGQFNLSNIFGEIPPDAFSIILVNFTGVALSTGCVVAYRPVNLTIA